MDKNVQAVPAYTSADVAAEANSVLRNTYLLLSMTLVFSSAMTAIAMILNIGHGAALVSMLLALGVLWLVLPRTAQSGAGLVTVFVFTGLMGFGLGPTLNMYLKAVPHGGVLIMSALGGTGLIFGSLSVYALTTKKDFSFMGGFLYSGLMVLIITGIGGIAAAALGYDVSVLQLGMSAATILVFSGLVLYDTSRIIHRGETNYIMATVELYLDILNIFLALLRLLSRR